MCGDVPRLRDLPPLVAERHDLAAVALRDLDPALAERAGGDDEDAAARSAEIRHRRLHRAGPGRREEQHVGRGAAELLQALEALPIDRPEVGPRWWTTGCASAASTSGGTGVGPGVKR